MKRKSKKAEIQYSVTAEQLQKMKTAIGYQEDKLKQMLNGKDLVFEWFRNHLITRGEDQDLISLVNQGLMTYKVNGLSTNGQTFWFVSDEGFKYLSKVIGVNVEKGACR